MLDNAVGRRRGGAAASAAADGIAVGSAGLFLGMVVALGAGAVVGGDDLPAP